MRAFLPAPFSSALVDRPNTNSEPATAESSNRASERRAMRMSGVPRGEQVSARKKRYRGYRGADYQIRREEIKLPACGLKSTRRGRSWPPKSYDFGYGGAVTSGTGPCPR